MIVALFAVDDNGGMGYQGTMPWPRNKQDMMWFKRTTQDNIVVMGKNTWNSTDMPIPLPNRLNVLITHDFIEDQSIIQLRGDICGGLLKLDKDVPNQDVYVIGGPNILMQAIPVIEKAFITRMPGEYINDTTIDVDAFLEDFELVDVHDLDSCIVEEYNKCNNT